METERGYLRLVSKMTDKRKYYGLWTAIVLLLCLNLGTIGWIILKTRQVRTNRQNPEGFITGQLMFSPQQQATYQGIRSTFLRSIRPHEDSLRMLREGLYGRLNQPTVPDDNLDALVRQMEQQNSQITRLRFRHWQQVRQLCSPAQQVQFNRFLTFLTRRLTQSDKPGPRKRLRDRLY